MAIVSLILSFFAVLVATPASAVAPDIAVGSLSYFARVGQSVNSDTHPTFTVSNFSGTPTFTVSPSLPNGLVINSSTGEITGTPTVGINTTAFTVTATYNSEVDSATFDLAVGENITIQTSVTSVTPSVANTSAITLNFGHTSIVNNANGRISVVLQNATPTSPGSCAGVTLSPAASSCSLTHSGSTYTYDFAGVNFSNLSTTFTMTFAAGTLLASSNGFFGLNVNLANSANESSLNFGAPGITIGSGNNQQQNQPVAFTVAQSSFSRGSAPSFSTLAVGDSVPAFTLTFSGFSGGAAVEQVNIVLGDPDHGIFYTIPSATTANGNNLVGWNPSSSNCGITAIRIGGVAQTASSGISCLKSTGVYNGVTQYWNALKFSTPTTAEISIDTAAGVFVVSQAGNLNYAATLINNTVTPRLLSHVVQAFDGSNVSSPAQPVSPVSFTIPVAPGQRIVGEDIAITATDLALSTDYSVVLRSTPQVLAQGRTVSSSFNTSVTIPNNLEAGWHSITFSATRSDGTALEEKVYFKINADGTLLASSTDVPAELAFTGMITAGAVPLSIIVLLMGFAAFFIAREINPDFMRVMTLTRNAQGELDFVKRRIRSEDF